MKRIYDVIIVGCGVAGCFAALHLPESADILMITKAELEESDSFLAQGGICVLHDAMDYDSFFEDTMRAGHYENRKESVDIMIRSSRNVINQLIDYGVDFAKENGELLYTREGAHSRNRILYHEDITGKEITSTLLARVQEKQNVTIMTQTEMVDILEKDNQCDGMILFRFIRRPCIRAIRDAVFLFPSRFAAREQCYIINRENVLWTSSCRGMW